MKYMNHSGLSQTPEATISEATTPSQARHYLHISLIYSFFWDGDARQLGLGEDGGELPHDDPGANRSCLVACMSADLSCNHRLNPRPPQVRHSAIGWTDVFNYSSIRSPAMQVFPELV
jgi:hypothetical protein